MNFRGLLSNIRVRCRTPRAQQPSDRTLLVLLSTHVQNLLIEANLRGRYWAVDETEITVNPNVSEYLIGMEGFGKALEVRAVESANGREYDVDFYELGDLNFEEHAPFWTSWFPESFGPASIAQRVAFFRRNGNIYLRTGRYGAPAGTRYRIIFQLGRFGDTQPLDEDIFLPEFASLAEIRTAISALPHCDWFDDEARNERRREQLALSLAEDARQVYPLFKSWVATQTSANQPNYRYLDPIDA